MKTIILITILSIIGFTLKAQDSLTIEQCREKAIAYNKQIKKAEYQKQEAHAYKKIAQTAYLPAISADVSIMYRPEMDDIVTPGGFLPTANSEVDAQAGNYSGISNIYSPGVYIEMDHLTFINGGFSLNQPLFTGGKIYYSNKKAKAGVEITEFNYQLKYSEVIELTNRTFWQIAMLESNIELIQSYILTLTELEEQMIEMYELGLIPASEKLKVSVQKNETELQLLKLKNGLKISKIYLNQIIGNDINTENNIKYNTFEVDLFDATNGIETARDNRNELKILQKQVIMSEYDKKLAKSDYLPTAGISMQYSSLYVNELYDDKTEFKTMISGQITIPIFSWGQGWQKQKAAELSVLQAKENLSITNDMINLEVKQTEVKITEAYEAIQVAQKNIIEAEESLAETKASFNVGLNTTTDLLKAQADLQNTKTQLIRAKIEYKLMETKWKRVTGQLIME